MTRGEAVNWLINITSDIGKIEHQDLWHYEQALSEIRELLESQPEVIACGSGELIVETTGDLISRQAAIDAMAELQGRASTKAELKGISKAWKWIKKLPSAQSDIIRCNACKHWTQTTGNMTGFGLGDCDYLDAKLVNCNGYCYWAERREE